jgi:hypothetical protein
VFRDSFVHASARGGPSAIFFARSSTTSFSSSPGTLRLINPISAASLPVIGSPSISISFARRNPINRGKSGTPPSPAVIPFFT